MAKTVAIIDGFAEGTWNTLELAGALEQAGFTIEPDASVADCIITHSAGCFFIPPTKKLQTILLIGPPYWPGKPLIVSLVQKIYRDFQAARRRRGVSYWLVKSAWNLYYFFGDLVRTVRIGKHAMKRNFHEAFVGQTPLLVRNKNDAWLTPNVTTILGEDRFKYYELPGEHDDCWTNPEPYVQLLLKNL